MIKVLLADDHPMVRAGLKQLFGMTLDMHAAAEACNGKEVLLALQTQSFDLLLLDLNLPGFCGADLIARVQARHPDLPVLMFSMHNEPQIARRILQAGASGYLTKDSEPDLILSAIRRVASGGRYIAPALAEQIALEATSSQPTLPHTQLSNREADIFLRLIQGIGIKDIAADLHISHKTVSTHKARLLVKLKLHSITDLVRYAMEHQLLA